MTKSKPTLSEVKQEKADRMMNGVAYWASFYRSNPHRFVADYLNVKLKTFQKILIYCFATNYYVAYIASRGSGKTWLTALYIVVRCILYPGTKVCIASGTKSQSIEVIQKIETDFMVNHGWGSINLRNEIKFISSAQNNARVDFMNGSFAVVVTSNSNARHNRANCIVVDEYRMVDPDVIQNVLRRFLTAPRTPGYLNNPKYAHLAERNCEIYMSSAWFKSHWSYKKVQSYFANMLDPTKKYFCCALPYQLAIKTGLLMREQLEDEMSEEDFDPVSFSMEMEALFYGEADGAFFRYDDIAPRRKIKKCFLPLPIYRSHQMKVPDLAPSETRLLAVDVALMASKKHKNDAGCCLIDSCIANEKNNYSDNIVYIESNEGLTTDEFGLVVMRAFYQYGCTDLALDTNGQGIGVYDFIIKNQYDPEYGVTYNALTCINDPAMADRCKVKNAKKCVWSIKANSAYNTTGALNLRAAFQNGSINLLIPDYEADDVIKDIRGYKSFSETEKALAKVPYIQTKCMVNELINLDHELKGTSGIKIIEKSGMRKDRYSALMYAIATTHEISVKKRPQDNGAEKDILKLMKIRPPKLHRRF